MGCFQIHYLIRLFLVLRTDIFLPMPSNIQSVWMTGYCDCVSLLISMFKNLTHTQTVVVNKSLTSLILILMCVCVCLCLFVCLRLEWTRGKTSLSGIMNNEQLSHSNTVAEALLTDGCVEQSTAPPKGHTHSCREPQLRHHHLTWRMGRTLTSAVGKSCLPPVLI